MTRLCVPYTCPRCGYTTNMKPNMRKHLFFSKKNCATKVSHIELTYEIKEHIINYRVYHIDQNDSQQNRNLTQNNNVTINYNPINTFVSNMNFESKLDNYLKYINKGLNNFEESVEFQ